MPCLNLFAFRWHSRKWHLPPPSPPSQQSRMLGGLVPRNGQGARRCRHSVAHPKQNSTRVTNCSGGGVLICGAGIFNPPALPEYAESKAEDSWALAQNFGRVAGWQFKWRAILEHAARACKCRLLTT